MKMTVKSGDTVLVIAGKDKGKTGKVTGVQQGKVLVENINMVSKHKKARTQNEKSGIVRKNAPIDASNVMVVCPVCGKATRVAHSLIDSKMVRSCKKCGASLDKEFTKKTKKDAKKTIKASDMKGTSFKAVSKKGSTKETEEKVEAPVSEEKAVKTAKSTQSKTSTKKVETKEKKEGTGTTKKTTTKAKTSETPKTTKKSTTAKSETK